jgi:hypothetical protein
MRTLLSAVLAAVVVASTIHAETRLEIGSGTYAGTPPEIKWYGHAYYLNEKGEPGIGVGMSGNVVVYDSYNTSVGGVGWSSMGGSWSGDGVVHGDWTVCYYSAINAATFDQYRESYGSTTCNPRPPLPPPPKDGYELVDCPTSPLVLALDGRYLFSSPDDPVLFDINADGKKEWITWTSESGGVGFLAWDRNHNRLIDDGSELFGTSTRLAGGGVAENGFVALIELDSNGDLVIDVRDDNWPNLLLWTDSNHDGVSQVTELQHISDTTVKAFGTAYGPLGRRDSDGNLLSFKGYADIENGRRPIYDVYFKLASSN